MRLREEINIRVRVRVIEPMASGILDSCYSSLNVLRHSSEKGAQIKKAHPGGQARRLQAVGEPA
ncbi:hypothetical protein DWB85_18565 [Seongchinamella sediminis]|uniref:Uncharacterized protein n=1 Tax=Seongchinamella sediminis TaxID=2283635 RepID=A0A3L7DUI8_9GAMM|nr:hypothetical protein DWB85_18565 [Seongchinamella sediminis]